MGTPKISSFIVGLILASMIISVLSLFIVSVSVSTVQSYDNSSFESYNKLTELSVMAEELEGKSDIQGNENALDIIGNYFTKGYQAVKVTTSSFDYFDTMNTEAVSQINMGAAAHIFRIGFSTIVLIIIIVGVFIAAIMKWAV